MSAGSDRQLVLLQDKLSVTPSRKWKKRRCGRIVLFNYINATAITRTASRTNDEAAGVEGGHILVQPRSHLCTNELQETLRRTYRVFIGTLYTVFPIGYRLPIQCIQCVPSITSITRSASAGASSEALARSSSESSRPRSETSKIQGTTV